MNKIVILFLTNLCFCLPINAAEYTMEFNGTTTIHNGITVSFSTGTFTNSSDGSLMDLYSNHPWATPLNGGDDYMDISISSSSYIFNITVAWSVNVQGLVLQFLNMNSIVSEISNFNAGGKIVTPTLFSVNTTTYMIRILDAAGSNSGGFELSHLTFDGLIPVELTSFSAAAIGTTIKLNWQTATEINNYGFEVERCALSAERQAWIKIGFVNGNGNSNSPKSYSFVDDKVSARKYSYRLKQIDNDGQFEYSKTVEVDMNGVNKFELSQNYPNPFNLATKISYSLPQAGMVRLTLYNILGQELLTLVNEVKEEGTHNFNFDASDLNSGMYIYKIESGSFSQTRKMTL